MTTSHEKYKPFCTTTWVRNLWQYLETCDSTLHMKNIPPYKCPREHDSYIMDIIHYSNISLTSKRICNQVRISLQVLIISDIVNVGHTTQLNSNILARKRNRTSTWEWPRIANLPASQKRVWKKTLIKIILPEYNNVHQVHEYQKVIKIFIHSFKIIKVYMTRKVSI